MNFEPKYLQVGDCEGVGHFEAKREVECILKFGYCLSMLSVVLVVHHQHLWTVR